jgi:hypothetical protein
VKAVKINLNFTSSFFLFSSITMADGPLRAEDFGEGGMKALLIPIRNSEESVEVRLEELPEDPSDILDILKAEVAPLEVWLKFAVCHHLL